MAMNPENGTIREIMKEDDVKSSEVIFKNGELISIKGCIFKIENIYPNPENRLFLVGQPVKLRSDTFLCKPCQQDGHMI